MCCQTDVLLQWRFQAIRKVTFNILSWRAIIAHEYS